MRSFADSGGKVYLYLRLVGHGVRVHLKHLTRDAHFLGLLQHSNRLPFSIAWQPTQPMRCR